MSKEKKKRFKKTENFRNMYYKTWKVRDVNVTGHLKELYYIHKGMWIILNKETINQINHVLIYKRKVNYITEWPSVNLTPY